MRNAALNEGIVEVAEAIKVLDDQSEFPHQPRILEIFGQIRVGFGDEQRIVVGERRNKGRIDGEVLWDYIR